MHVTVERAALPDGRPVLHVRGELDLATVPALADAVRTAVAEAPPGLVLDLTGTQFLDSTGCRELVRSARAGTAAGVEVVLVCPRGNVPVRRVLDMLDLVALVPVLEVATAPTGPSGDDAP